MLRRGGGGVARGAGGLTRAERLGRALEVLKVTEADLLHLAERRCTLPSPALGHGTIVADLDHQLAGSRLMLTGNYFDGKLDEVKIYNRPMY